MASCSVLIVVKVSVLMLNRIYILLTNVQMYPPASVALLYQMEVNLQPSLRTSIWL